MELAEDRPNVELRRAGGSPIVVLAFPYDARLVALVRRIPGRRFDWESREWWAPLDDWAGIQVAEVVRRFPELTTSAEVDAWLRAVERRWVGRVTTTRHDGRGWLVLRTRAGPVPEPLLDGAVEQEDGSLLVPLTRAAAEALGEQRSARLDGGALRCVAALERGEDPVPPARLALHQGTEGERFKLDVLWDPDTGAAFEDLPGAEQAGRVMPLDPWVVDTLDGFLAMHGVAVEPAAARALDTLREEAAEAAEAIRRSRSTSGEPIAEIAERLGGTLQPFQWAGRALRARRPPAVPGRRTGPRQDGRGAGDAGGRRRLPGDRRLPGLAQAQLGARDAPLAAAPRASPSSRARSPCRRRATSRSSTTRSSPPTATSSPGCARRRSSSTSRTTPRTRRPSAPRPCAGWPRPSSRTGCAWRSRARRCSTTPTSSSASCASSAAWRTSARARASRASSRAR